MQKRILLILFATLAFAQDAVSPARLLMQTLNAELLESRSATATLEKWCRERKLAADPKIIANLIRGEQKGPSQEQRSRLEVTESDPVKYRRVQLMCGANVLSEAENWYVPGRLTAEMNRTLETTTTPFGAAVQTLEPYRKTFSVKMLWSGTTAEIPTALFEHRALVFTKEGKPFAEVIEIYQRALLN